VDEPSFTQPLMYKAIRSRPSSVQLYGNKLVQSGQMTEAWRTNLTAKLNQHLEAEYAAATTNYSAEGGSMWVKGCRPPVSAGHPALYDGTAFAGSWSSMQQATPADMARNDPTGVHCASPLSDGAGPTMPHLFHVCVCLADGALLCLLGSMVSVVVFSCTRHPRGGPAAHWQDLGVGAPRVQGAPTTG
jgi:hypothetical protein